MWNRWFVRINNWVTRRRKIRLRSHELLLLLPRCLQRKECPLPVTTDIAACKLCGLCDIAEIRKLQEEYGIRCHVAGGGRQALAMVKDSGVVGVVAVACDKELTEGIRAAFPKPVLAVSNHLPCGPCHDTKVDIAPVRAALEEWLGTPSRQRPSKKP